MITRRRLLDNLILNFSKEISKISSLSKTRRVLIIVNFDQLKKKSGDDYGESAIIVKIIRRQQQINRLTFLAGISYIKSPFPNRNREIYRVGCCALGTATRRPELSPAGIVAGQLTG